MQEGQISIEHNGRPWAAVPYHKMQARAEVVRAKELITKLAEKKKHRPSRSHPWKRGRRVFQHADTNWLIAKETLIKCCFEDR